MCESMCVHFVKRKIFLPNPVPLGNIPLSGSVIDLYYNMIVMEYIFIVKNIVDNIIVNPLLSIYIHHIPCETKCITIVLVSP